MTARSKPNRGASFVYAGVVVLAVAVVLAVSVGRAPPEGAFELNLFGREYSLAEPRALFLVLAFPLLWFVTARSLTGLSTAQRVVSVLLRTLFLGALVLGLGRVVEVEKSDRVCLVALLDVSDSVADEGLERGRKRLGEWFARARPDDSFELLVFGRNVARVPLGRDAEVRIPTVSELRKSAAGDASDLAQALDQAEAFRDRGCVARTVLLTDGIETRGDVSSALARVTSDSSKVHVASLSTEPPRDVAVTDVRALRDPTLGETFEILVEVSSTRSASFRVELEQGPLPNALEPSRRMTNFQGKELLTFRSVLRVPGAVTYRAHVVHEEGADRFAANDAATLTLDLPGPPRVLVVDRHPDQIRHVADALVAQEFDVDVRGVSAFPASSAELAPFAFVVLSDVARSELGRRGEDLLVRFVRGGGGLLYSGGEAGYGPGGWQGSELEKILPVRMDAEKRRETPGVALALVVDRSGSMNGLPLEMAKEACAATLEVLEASDLLEVIAFDSAPVRYVKMRPARATAPIRGEIQRIQAGAGTEVFPALDMAYQDLNAVVARKKHILLLTDGNASAEGIAELVGTAFADGITVTSVGLGTGVNEELLRMIAELGGGRFHLAQTPESLPRIFVRETELIGQEATRSDWFGVQKTASPEFLAGLPLDAAPYVRGYTRVDLGPAPAELLLATDEGAPLLARGRAGLGTALAWTSDLKTRWGKDWLTWRSFPKFVGQLVRAHRKKDDERVLPLDVSLAGDRARLRVDAFDSEERFDSTLEGRVAVTLRDARGAEKVLPELTLALTAPGTYEAEMPLAEYGSYVFVARHRRLEGEGATGPVVASGRASLSYPYAEELRRLVAEPGQLERLARTGRGVFEPSVELLWSAGSDRETRSIGRQSWLLFAALALYLLDLVARRVRFGALPQIG